MIALSNRKRRLNTCTQVSSRVTQADTYPILQTRSHELFAKLQTRKRAVLKSCFQKCSKLSPFKARRDKNGTSKRPKRTNAQFVDEIVKSARTSCGEWKSTRQRSSDISSTTYQRPENVSELSECFSSCWKITSWWWVELTSRCCRLWLKVTPDELFLTSNEFLLQKKSLDLFFILWHCFFLIHVTSNDLQNRSQLTWDELWSRKLTPNELFLIKNNFWVCRLQLQSRFWPQMT